METDQCCKTKYPIMLVHGAGFRDLKLPLYWGRIPKVLAAHGADIYYGLQDGWASTSANAAQLEKRICQILNETGAERINLIGHSKGGLEIRIAASSPRLLGHVASATTIATPHYGSKTMDKLLKAPSHFFNIAAFAVNNWIALIGDREPDFFTVCREFSTAHMERFNLDYPDRPDVYYQSYACVMRRPASDINLSTANFIISLIEGANDGLVSVRSARWGESFTVLKSVSRRGISHLDAIDFRRAPFSKRIAPDRVSDICDVYVDIVRKLKSMGF